MPEWPIQEVVKQVTEVACYMEHEFKVKKHNRFDCQKYENKEDPWEKTFVIECGVCDGEYIDLFQLQEWFDKNREWIDGLKKEI